MTPTLPVSRCCPFPAPVPCVTGGPVAFYVGRGEHTDGNSNGNNNYHWCNPSSQPMALHQSVSGGGGGGGIRRILIISSNYQYNCTAGWRGDNNQSCCWSVVCVGPCWWSGMGRIRPFASPVHGLIMRINGQWCVEVGTLLQWVVCGGRCWYEGLSLVSLLLSSLLAGVLLVGCAPVVVIVIIIIIIKPNFQRKGRRPNNNYY